KESVDLDEPAIEFDSGRFESDILGEGPPADGDQEHLGFEFDRLAVLRGRDLYPVSVPHDLLDFRAGVHADAAFLERALELCAEARVFERNQAGEQLD